MVLECKKAGLVPQSIYVQILYNYSSLTAECVSTDKARYHKIIRHTNQIFQTEGYRSTKRWCSRQTLCVHLTQCTQGSPQPFGPQVCQCNYSWLQGFNISYLCEGVLNSEISRCRICMELKPADFRPSKLIQLNFTQCTPKFIGRFITMYKNILPF